MIRIENISSLRPPVRILYPLSHLSDLHTSFLHDLSSHRILQALTGFTEALKKSGNQYEFGRGFASEHTARHEYFNHEIRTLCQFTALCVRMCHIPFLLAKLSRVARIDQPTFRRRMSSRLACRPSSILSPVLFKIPIMMTYPITQADQPMNTPLMNCHLLDRSSDTHNYAILSYNPRDPYINHRRQTPESTQPTDSRRMTDLSILSHTVPSFADQAPASSFPATPERIRL